MPLSVGLRVVLLPATRIRSSCGPRAIERVGDSGVDIGRVLVALLVMVGLGACDTTGSALLEAEAAEAAGSEIIWEQDRSCELSVDALAAIPGVVTIGRAQAVAVQIQVDGTTGMANEAVILGEGSGTAALDEALLDAALRMRFDCAQPGLALGRRVYFI